MKKFITHTGAVLPLMMFLLLFVVASCSSDEKTPEDEPPTPTEDVVDEVPDDVEDPPPPPDDVTDEVPDDVTDDVPDDVPDDIDEPIETGPWSVPLGPEDTTFHVGPYLGHTTTTSVTISWETLEEGSTVVEYGLDETYGERFEGAPGTMHHAVLEGLEPATLYHYRACTDDTCTRNLTFATAPGPNRPFRFAVYGDSRSNPERHRAVVENIIADNPAIVLNTGDIVADGDQRHEYKEMHFDPLRALGHYLPVYVAIGNHEWRGEVHNEAATFREYLAFPEDSDVPVPGLSFSVTYGDAFFLFLDNTLDGGHFFQPLGRPPGPPLWVWLNEQVNSEEAQNARWRFAFFHYPPNSPCQESWGMILSTREFVIPLLREHGFNAVFAGHVHHYEKHDFDGMPVVVTGGGGAGLQNMERCVLESDTVESIVNVHHHTTVDLGEDKAILRAVDIDGEVFDTFEFD